MHTSFRALGEENRNMTPTEEAIQVIRSKRWRTAKVWDYSISHSILRLRMDESDEGLVFHDCDRIEFEVVWKVGDIQVEQYGEGNNKRYRVTDGKNLYVDCGQVYFCRNTDFGL